MLMGVSSQSRHVSVTRSECDLHFSDEKLKLRLVGQRGPCLRRRQVLALGLGPGVVSCRSQHSAGQHVVWEGPRVWS